MVAPNNQIWWKVVITLVSETTGSTITLPVSNRPPMGESTWFIPGIISINGIGNRAGLYLPDVSQGTIVLDNTRGNVCYNRRIADYFDGYTPVGQSVVIYETETSWTNQTPDLAPNSDYSQVWQGICSTWSFTGQNKDQITLSIASNTIKKRTITKIVDSTRFANAPTKSIGKYLPIVIGETVQVKPIQIAADADASPEYAYATTYSTVFPVGGVQQYYAKNHLGNYVAVSAAATTSTLLFGYGSASDNTASVWGTLTPTPTFAKKITVTTGYIVTSGVFRCSKSAGTDSGVIEFQVCAADKWQSAAPTAAPGTVLGSAKYATSALGAGAVNPATITFSFPKPIVMGPGTYWMVFRYYATGATNYVSIRYDNGIDDNSTTAILNSTDKENDLWVESAGGPTRYRQFWELYGVVATDTKSSAGDADGLGHASVELTQAASPTPMPDLTTLDLLFSINGLKDDSSGTITGTANLLIQTPPHAIRLLDKEWSGSTWTGGDINWSSSITAPAAAAYRYIRTLAGRTDGRQTLEGIYQEICRNGGIRLAMFNDASDPIKIFSWGGNVASSYTITDEEAVIISIEGRGTDTVINRVIAQYAQQLQNVDAVNNVANPDNLSAFLDTESSTYFPASIKTSLAAISQTAFGKRELRENIFRFIDDAGSMAVMAEFFLATYAFPHRYVRFQVPYPKYKTLQPFNVVTLCHPTISAYYGTSPDARMPYHSGSETNPNLGHHLRAAKDVRIFIDSLEINWAQTSIPLLTIGGRILGNHPKDPT